MLPEPIIALLLASLTAAAPGKNLSQQHLSMWLSAKVFTVSTEVRPTIDGVFHAVKDFAYPVSSVIIGCLGDCVPEYHCTLYDKNLNPFITVPPGTTQLNTGKAVHQVSCALGLPPKPPQLIEDLEIPQPSQSRSQKTQSVALFSTFWAEVERLEIPADGAVVAVDEEFRHFSVDVVEIDCDGACVPELHCTLYDKNSEPFISLFPGQSEIVLAQPVYGVSCKTGLPPP